MKLSLCLAVFNEENNLHYALDSAYGLVDEVVVVDGGSTDRTRELALAYGSKVRIIKTDNPPMFHINKQKAISAAKGDWILQLDADEAVSKELKQEIKSIVHVGDGSSVPHHAGGETPPPQYMAYKIPRKNFFLNRFLMKGGQYPDYTIRLYRNGVAHFPCKDVHENVAVKGAVGHLKHPLLHYSDPTFGRYWQRWQRYTSLEAKQLKEGQASPGVIDYLLVKPAVTFFSMYCRHKGFMDGPAGLIFAFFSSIRFWAIYVRYLQLAKSTS
ncbi:glycosyltransferase family 2 protein [Patescibacteria group bacterium]|nr:glycosyltransferase family 2 protein [Patescibacteria group bacterium]MCL5091973.1 glycosyltransferase family 2 protein [Patescibacteria group bacterium]